MIDRQTIEVEWVVTLEGYKKAYAEANKLPPEQAKIAIDALDRQLKADEKAHKAKIAQIREEEKNRKAAADAQKKAEDAQKKADDELAASGKKRFDALKKVASAFGGTLNDLVGKTDNLGQGLGSLAGPAGLAAAGVGVLAFSVRKAGEALWDFMEGSSEALERLNEIAGVPPLPPYVADEINRWEEASLNAEAAGLRLKTTVAAALSPTMSDFANIVAGAKGMATDLVDDWREARKAADDLRTSVDGMVDDFRRANGVIGEVGGTVYDGATGLYDYYQNWGLVGIVLDKIKDRGEQTRLSLLGLADAAKTVDSEWHNLTMTMMGATDVEMQVSAANKRIEDAAERQIALLKESGRWTEAEANQIKAQAILAKKDSEERIRAKESEREAERKRLDKEREAREAEREYRKWKAQQDKADAERQARLAEVTGWVTAATVSQMSAQEALDAQTYARIATIDKLVNDGLMSEYDGYRALIEIQGEYERKTDDIADKRKREVESYLKQIDGISKGGFYRGEIQSLEELEAARAEDKARFQQEMQAKREALKAYLDAFKGTEEERARVAEQVSAEVIQIAEEEKAQLQAIDANYDEQAQVMRDAAFADMVSKLGMYSGVAIEALGMIGDAVAEQFDRAKEQYEQAKSDLEKLRDQELELKKRLKQADFDVAKARIQQRLEDNKVAQEMARTELQERRKALRKAFAAEKLSAIASIGIQTAVAVMEAAPNVPLQIAMGVLGSVQAGIVAAKPMPQFHGGGAAIGMHAMPAAPVSAPYSPGPDEIPSVILKGESVLDRRATQQIGPENIERLNKGQPIQPPAPNFLVIDDQVIELLADRVARSRAFEQRLPRRGAR